MLAAATVLAQVVLAFVPPTSPLSSSPSSSSQTSSRLHVGNVNLDFYPGLRGLFDMGNIILDEVRAGRKEAQQEVAEITGWVAEKVGIQQHQQVLIQQQPVVLHPVFGELVKDLVYKKIYCTSVQKLATIPIWEQQRIYRAERAQLLANDIKAKLKDGKALTLPGSLTVYEMGDKIGLLDGQHRLGALKMLMESDVLIPEAHMILVEVFPVKAEEEVKRLFTEINTAQVSFEEEVKEKGEEGQAERIVGFIHVKVELSRYTYIHYPPPLFLPSPPPLLSPARLYDRSARHAR